MFIIILLPYIIEKYANIDLIKVAFYCNSIKNGGVERVVSLLINYLSKKKRFLHYLITNLGKLEGEYSIPQNTRRISLYQKNISLLELVQTTHIDILIVNSYDKLLIKELNKLNKTKIIYYNHSSFFFWLYKNCSIFTETIYYVYKECNYVISLIPVENDYLFKKWGINSILMDNPSTFEYEEVIPSDLKQKNIIMIGRASDILKRFDLGIKAMEIIVKTIPDCKMNIISFSDNNLVNLIKDLKLEKYVTFAGYHKNIEIFLKNSSLHILSSINEAYPMVLSETKIFGIPNIIIALDYLALSKRGTVIIHDDNPNTIAKEAIKILNDYEYRKKLGDEARKSMKICKNSIIVKKWTKLLLSVFNGENASHIRISENKRTISDKEAKKILNNQLILLKLRRPQYKNLSLEKLINYTLI